VYLSQRAIIIHVVASLINQRLDLLQEKRVSTSAPPTVVSGDPQSPPPLVPVAGLELPKPIATPPTDPGQCILLSL